MKTIQSILSILVVATALSACGTEAVELDPNVTLRILPPTSSQSATGVKVEYKNPNGSEFYAVSEIRPEVLTTSDWTGIEISVTEEGNESASYRAILNVNDGQIAQPLTITTAIPVDVEFKVTLRLINENNEQYFPEAYETVLRALPLASPRGQE